MTLKIEGLLPLFLCITSAVLAQENPTISYITPEQTGEIGCQANFKCTIQNARDDVLIRWVKINKENQASHAVSSGSDVDPMADSRYSVSFDAASATYTLSINDITEVLAGWYQCQVIISESNKIRAETELKVLRPPISDTKITQRAPTVWYITQEQKRYIGSQVDLDCIVQNAKESSVLWVKYNYKRNESMILSTQSTLVTKDSRFSLRFNAASNTYTLSIKDIKETDKGWYQCQVIHSVPSKILGETELEVQRPPTTEGETTQRTPSIWYITEEQLRYTESQVDLDCTVQNVKDSPVVWVKYDKKRNESIILSTGSNLVIRDSRFSVRFNAPSNTYTLSIKNIQKTDAGFYQCQVIITVSNRITEETKLKVRRLPIFSDNSTNKGENTMPQQGVEASQSYNEARIATALEALSAEMRNQTVLMQVMLQRVTKNDS